MSDMEARGKRKRRRSGSSQQHTPRIRQAMGGVLGGSYQPLNSKELEQIDQTARSILSDIGMADAPDCVVEPITDAGGHLDENSRLRFSPDLIDKAMNGFRRGFTLCGQDAENDILLGVGRVHTGSGGAAPLILDLDSGQYRESTLTDLYDAARLVDKLDNIHFLVVP